MAVDAKQDVKNYKRSLILDAASRLFCEKGFQKTTVDDIAAALSVTKPFIYTYFDNKYAILEALFDIIYEEVYSGIEKSLDQALGPANERLVRFVHVYLGKNIEWQKFSAILLEEEKNLTAEKLADIRRKQHLFDRKLAHLIESGVAEGVFAVADPSLASLAISGIVRWTHRWYSPTGRLTPAEICDEMSTLALSMLGYKPVAR